MDAASDPVRIDRWLWAARLVKTRGVAVELVNGGHVELNGNRIKPSRDVRPGDRMDLVLGRRRMSIVVLGTAPRRGPASEAKLLYEETQESRERNELEAERRRLAGPPPVAGGPRPTKRDRRRLDRGR